MFRLEKKVKGMSEDLDQLNNELEEGKKLTNVQHELIASYMRLHTVALILGGKLK